MILLDEALERIFDLVPKITETESVSLSQSAGRVLASSLTSQHNQPPFAAAAMDGFAIHSSEANMGNKFKIIGVSAAGDGFTTIVQQGETVRIFTGAPVPEGTDCIILQENTDYQDDYMMITSELNSERYIRPAGSDFTTGFSVSAPRVISPEIITLIAAMNIPIIEVVRRPKVAIIPTGNELIMPGEKLGKGNIVSSSGYGLLTMLYQSGASARLLPIANDSEESIQSLFKLALDADIIVTMGGASVGDHDLVITAAKKLGMSVSFHNISMRPGKPVFAGQLMGKTLIGLPGNPVSAMVCGRLILIPVIKSMLQLGQKPAKRYQAIIGNDLLPNGPREHFMRALLEIKNGQTQVNIYSKQDSSLLSVLAQSTVLAVRPPFDDKRQAGTAIEYIYLNPTIDLIQERMLN